MCAPHTGPAFIDFPLDLVFMEAEEAERAEVRPHAPRRADGGGSSAPRRCCATPSGR